MRPPPIDRDSRARSGPARGRAGGRDGVDPLLVTGIEPSPVIALRAAVDDVEVQRRGVVGEGRELTRALVRWCGVQQIDERHHREHPTPAIRTGGDRRRVEALRDLEQRRRLVRVELDPLAFIVDECELRHRGQPSAPSGDEGEATLPVGALPAGPVGTAGSVAVMRAVVFPGDGTIEIQERPAPRPEPGQVLVRVHGAGLNRADLMQRLGFYPAPPGVPPDIPGMEFSGTIAELGDGVADYGVGDQVFGIVGGGAQAEELVVPAAHCAPVPERIDPVEAGGIPEVFITAHDAMRTRAGLQPGEHVLVHAVGSGVGTAVVQLAQAFGCTVTGTARTQAKLDQARELGLDHGVRAESPLVVDALASEITRAGGPPHVIVDLVGGPYVAVDLETAAVTGRIVIVGTLAGGNIDLPLLKLMGKRLALHGTVLRARSVPEKAAATAGFVAEVLPLLERGRLQPVVDRILPLEEAEAAYALVESDATFGKVILQP
jgi:putative PIG3 family NAD(P)H quinone oxidoreductase